MADTATTGAHRATLRALANPHRLGILEVLAGDLDRSMPVRRLAEALGVPATRLYHHIGILVERGLVEPAATRTVNGIAETSYRVTPLTVALLTAPRGGRATNPLGARSGPEAEPPTSVEAPEIRARDDAPGRPGRVDGMEARAGMPAGAGQVVSGGPASRTIGSHPAHLERRTLRKSRWAELVAISMAVLVGTYALGVFSFGSVRFDDLDAGGEAEIESPFGPAEPDDDYFLLSRAGGPGKLLDEAAVLRGRQQARNIRAATASENAALPASAPRQLTGPWTLVGPTNVGGRIVDLVVDIDDPDTIYVAAASGGVWKSTDAAVTMEFAWNDNFPQGMGAITMGSDGRLWAGTGETQPGGGSITFPGDGVYVSSDRGASWRNVGLRDSKTIGEIVVDPTNPDRIFVAASGSLYNPDGERGIYRSDTGGANWKRILAPETSWAGGVDLAIDPTNPNRIFAAMWDHRREPAVRTYGGLGSGLYRSDDGGDTWTRLDNVLTYSAGDSVGGEPLGLNQSIYLGRIGVALAPNNPNRVYVITTKTDGTDGGFYISDDGGDSFNASGPNSNNRPGQQGGFGWWFGRLWVDPLDQNHVFVAGVAMRRSTNGGVSWSSVGGLHADQHALQFATAIPGRVYVGNDGGTYRSNNNGASGFVQAIVEPYTQFYTLDVSESDPQRVVGGAQDNGSNRSWNSSGVVAPGGTGWTSHGGGDGESNVIDYNDQLRMYYCSQYGSCTRSSNGGNSGSGFGSRAGTRNNWTAPVVLDPNDPSIVYYGSNVLSRSTNYAQTFTRLSPPEIDLTGTFEPGQNVSNINGPYPNWGTITTISPSKTDPNLVYLGTDTGRLWKTPDLGTTWIEFNTHGLPSRWVTRVQVDPTNADVVYATFSGYKAGDDAAHVYKTTDGGTTWQNISGNLPNAPVNDIVVDTANSTIYVGTDVGVFYLKNGKKNWKSVGTGLPLSPVMDLRLHGPTNTLYAATFGRSMWSIDLSQ